jgi:hypothetical protein
MFQLNDYLNKINVSHPIAIGLIIILSFFAGFVSIKIWGPNNPVEKIAEEVLESEGISVQFEKTN